MKTRIYFVRHGNAENAKHDMSRPLSAKGEEQAENRRKSFQGLEFDLAISSPATRCVQTTAQIIAVGGASVRICLREALYIPGKKTRDGKTLNEAFDKIGYQSLSAYMRTKAKDGIKRYGVKNAAIVRRIIAEFRAQPTNVLVVGHAVLLQAIAAEFASDKDAFPFHINLGEAEVIMVELQSGKVSWIK